MTTHRAMLRQQREAMAELPGQLAQAEAAQATIYAAAKKAQRALQAEVDDLRAAIAERDDRIGEMEKALKSAKTDADKAKATTTIKKGDT